MSITCWIFIFFLKTDLSVSQFSPKKQQSHLPPAEPKLEIKRIVSLKTVS